MSATAAAAIGPARRARAFGVWGHEAVVLALWLVELAVFAAIGHNFATPGNALEILRTSTEVGLLALALTLVIVSGGIDLSVGSLMGLSAVLCGLLWRDGGLPIGVAAALAVAAAGAAGLLNAVLVARLQLAPLIVTLGTYSLFRGLAKGLTAGVETYADFPAGFLFLGQGYLGGVLPVQLVVLAAAAIAFGVLLHRTPTGRSLQAIGFASEAARHAGIPVARTTATAYVLASLTAGVAAVLYVARVGQAKADAGTSYELMAITAVVLGGTSIFGGRGTIHGTVLGVLAIATLQNGLRLADLPVELTGILAGALLVGSIAVRRLLSGRSHS
ncbi:MAG TPA: ABC transporter permease [Vicinamibacteria bacterium]|nr:ABC transporter permease [Vicinamibacteria bacterium]